MSNSIGEKFRITSFGASHGVGVGAIVDGCPANLELTAEDIQKELDKRKPGTSSVTTPRKEADEVQILSGIFEKYGNYDYNGGGRGSGRVTIGHVIGGAIAKKLLKTQNIEIVSHVTQIGDIKASKQDFDTIKENIEKNPVRCGDLDAAREMEKLILAKKDEGDSVGGIVETIAVNVPAGLGEPVFGRIDGDLARILMNIGAVKGVEIGLGFDVANRTGSGRHEQWNADNIQNCRKTYPVHFKMSKFN